MAEIAGLISSIVTFIDFSFKIVSGAKDVRNSAQGMTEEVRQLEHILRDAQHYNDLVKTQRASGQWFSHDELDVLGMVSECEELARKLRKLMDTLKMRADARSRTLESARVFTRSFLKENEIKSLRSQLDSMAAQIWKHVANVMSEERHSSILKSLAEIRISCSQLDIKYPSKLDSITQDILALNKQTQQANEHQKVHQRQQLTDLKAYLDTLLREKATCAQQIKLLKSLYFPELRRRWNQIPEAEKQTNEWIYDPEKTSFLQWLESQKAGDGLFYIIGKAGSGKSTLMKSIAESEQTAKCLQKWAGTSKLYTAEFYFWNQGTEMQKSAGGLFQSLLYQIFRSAPDLIIPTCKDRLSHEVWEMKDLLEVYQAMAKQTNFDNKFCFFIDGLDEYGGEEKDIVQILQTLSTVRHIKICASSRPGRQYEDFLRHGGRTIEIAHFTEEDMRKYVDTNLQASVQWQELVKMEPTCQDIIYEISIRASGVWLWVFLVTRDIIKEADKSEGVATLRRIVDEFPDDLYAYFERTIKRIPKRHREEMAQIFLTILESRGHLPLYAIAMLAEDAEDEDFAIKAPIKPVRVEDFEPHFATWRNRLRNRCGDLLVVHEERDRTLSKSFSVDFLHRTVYDFLKEYDGQLRSYLHKKFDPLLFLFKVYLILLKIHPITDEAVHNDQIHHLTSSLLFCARELEKRNTLREGNPLVRLVDHLDMVNNKHACSSGYHQHWANKWGGLVDEDFYAKEERNFFALAVEYSLVNYMGIKLATDQHTIKKPGRPLLVYALCADLDYADIAMVELLLSQGANPNESVPMDGNESVWAFFLRWIEKLKQYYVVSNPRYQFSGEGFIYQAAHLLIQAGARSDCLPEGDGSAVSILNRVLGRDNASILVQEMKQVEYEAKQKAAEEEEKQQRENDIEEEGNEMKQKENEVPQSSNSCVAM